VTLLLLLLLATLLLLLLISLGQRLDVTIHSSLTCLKHTKFKLRPKMFFCSERQAVQVPISTGGLIGPQGVRWCYAPLFVPEFASKVPHCIETSRNFTSLVAVANGAG
jgi:hypothetical protein